MRSGKKEKGQSSGFLGKLGVGILGVVVGFALRYLIQSQKNKQRKKQQSNQNCQQTCQYPVDIQNYDEMEELMTCPISQEIMVEPAIVIQCGHTFERKVITNWVQTHKNCPLCKVETNLDSIKINYQLKNIIAQYGHQRKKEQLQQKTNEKQAD